MLNKLNFKLSSAMATDSLARGLVGDPTNLIAILWRGRKLIGMCMLTCLMLAFLYLVNSPRMYQATAKLLIFQQGGRPLSMVNADQARLGEGAEDYVPTHAIVVKSRMVVGRAIESVGLRNLPTLAAAATPEKALTEAIKNLTVTRPDRQAKILQIDYRARSREEAVKMVDAIAASYRTFLEDVYQKNNSEVVYLMTKARDDLNTELKELEQKYLEFRQDSPLLTSDGTGRPLIVRRIDEWNQAISAAMVRAIQLKEQLELGRKLATDGVGLWSISYAMDQLSGQGGGLGTRAQAFSPAQPSDYVRQLNQEQQRLSERYGPQNTKVREIQEQISQVLEQSRGARSRIEQVEVRDLLDSISHGLKSNEAMRAKLAEQFEKDLSVAKKTEIALLADANLKSNLERQRTLFNTVVDQLKQAKLVGDFSSLRAETIESANALQKAVRPLISLSLALAIVAGAVLGAGAALVNDMLDPKVRSVEEIRKVLHLPVLGQLPRLAEASGPQTGPLGLICHAAPRSPTAEAYKVARANLDLARRDRGVRTVLVTSPHASEGKSSVASNLAICLAQAGRRVLLVDADLRQPSQHRIHNLQRDRGLAHVLRDLLTAGRVTQPTAIKNLTLIASGPEASNPVELLSSPLLHTFLDEVREAYDAVIIDAPPLLAVADPSIVGAVADGIVFVVRMSETNRDEASKAMEILKGIGTPVLGVIANGVDPDSATYPPLRGQPDEARGERDATEIRPDPKLSFAPGMANGTSRGVYRNHDRPGTNGTEEAR